MAKATVEFKTRGVKGGDFSQIKKTANAVVFVDGVSYISVDSFNGRGDSYSQREHSEITISIADVSWKGTADDLYELLRK